MEKLTGEEKTSKSLRVLKQTSVRETYPLHTHTFYEYFLVIKGRALHRVNNVTQIVERGSLVFVRPNDEHCYDYYKSQDFEFYNVGVFPEQFKHACSLYYGEPLILNDGNIPKQVKLSDEKILRLEQWLLQMQQEENDKTRDRLSAFILSLVIFYMLSSESENLEGGLPLWLIALLDKMSLPENFALGLPRMLELCNYSQEHINREFRRYLNTTPTKYINQLRVLYAEKLLAEGMLDTLDICFQCGFSSVSRFYAVFKEYFGYAPKKAKR